MVGFSAMTSGNKHDTNKSNIMLCDKHVMCGSCPYEGRCKYIHDKSLAAPHDFLLKRLRNDKDWATKECAANKDSFYWPNMPRLNNGYGGGCYDISACCDPKFYLRHRSVYSIWKHFKQFCIEQVPGATSGNPAVMDNSVTINQYTCAKRLNVFVSLSQGHSLQTSEQQSSPTQDSAVTKLTSSPVQTASTTPSRRTDSDLSDASSSDLCANAAEYYEAATEEAQQRYQQQLYENKQKHLQAMYQMEANASRSHAKYGAPSCYSYQYTGSSPMYAALAPRDYGRAILQSPEQANRKSWVL